MNASPCSSTHTTDMEKEKPVATCACCIALQDFSHVTRYDVCFLSRVVEIHLLTTGTRQPCTETEKQTIKTFLTETSLQAELK